jgi:hypothetical protein
MRTSGMREEVIEGLDDLPVTVVVVVDVLDRGYGVLLVGSSEAHAASQSLYALSRFWVRSKPARIRAPLAHHRHASSACVWAYCPELPGPGFLVATLTASSGVLLRGV